MLIAMIRQQSMLPIQNVHWADVATIPKTFAGLGVVVAEVDEQLRYVWIENPHPDFDAKSVVGKRDDELISKADADEIMRLKRETFDRQVAMSRVLSFKRSDGVRYYNLTAYPIIREAGKAKTILTLGFDVPQSSAD